MPCQKQSDELGREKLWLILMFWPNICLEGIWETTKPSNRVAVFHKIVTRIWCNTSPWEWKCSILPESSTACCVCL